MHISRVSVCIIGCLVIGCGGPRSTAPATEREEVGEEVSVPETSLCAGLRYDIGECAMDPGALCAKYESDLAPEIAAQAIACLREELALDDCSMCDIYACTESTLLGQPKAVDERCTNIVYRSCMERTPQSNPDDCEIMRSHCNEYIAGMNVEGAKRLLACLENPETNGVMPCIWSPDMACSHSSSYR